MSDAVDTHFHEYTGDETFELDVYDYFQNMDSFNAVQEDSTVEDILDTIVQDTMGFVMIVSVMLMAVVFVLILRLKDMKIEKQ